MQALSEIGQHRKDHLTYLIFTDNHLYIGDTAVRTGSKQRWVDYPTAIAKIFKNDMSKKILHTGFKNLRKIDKYKDDIEAGKITFNMLGPLNTGNDRFLNLQWIPICYSEKEIATKSNSYARKLQDKYETTKTTQARMSTMERLFIASGIASGQGSVVKPTKNTAGESTMKNWADANNNKSDLTLFQKLQEIRKIIKGIGFKKHPNAITTKEFEDFYDLVKTDSTEDDPQFPGNDIDHIRGGENTLVENADNPLAALEQSAGMYTAKHFKEAMDKAEIESTFHSVERAKDLKLELPTPSTWKIEWVKDAYSKTSNVTMRYLGDQWKDPSTGNWLEKHDLLHFRGDVGDIEGYGPNKTIRLWHENLDFKIPAHLFTQYIKLVAAGRKKDDDEKEDPDQGTGGSSAQLQGAAESLSKFAAQFAIPAPTDRKKIPLLSQTKITKVMTTTSLTKEANRLISAWNKAPIFTRDRHHKNIQDYIDKHDERPGIEKIVQKMKDLIPAGPPVLGAQILPPHPPAPPSPKGRLTPDVEIVKGKKHRLKFHPFF